MNKNIGIIGQGFVGNAVNQGLKSHFNILTYDKYQADKSNSTLSEIVKQCSVIFVCVPTPMNTETGEAYTGIVESVIKDLDYFATAMNKPTIAVIKSTIPPGTTVKLDNSTTRLRVAFNPEFLTEANAVNDFLTQDRIIIGANHYSTSETVAELYQHAFPNATIIEQDATSAEMVKYVSNCFLAVKVSFANEMYDLCTAVGANWQSVIESVKLDRRMGTSHWQVPGPDGHRGFGLSCFPKDINAMIRVGELNHVEMTTLKGAWAKNLEVRPEKDWEELKGRAVINIS